MAGILSWFRANEPPLSTAQRWGIAAGGVLTEVNRGGFDSLWFSFGRVQSRDGLRSGWGVNDRQSLQKIHDWLAREGHRVSCYRVLREVQAIEAGDLPYDPAGTDAPLYTWVSEHAAQIQRTKLIAWDLCRLVNVARWGYTAGYIDEKTAWNWITESTQAIQGTCSSWRDVGEDFLTGFGFWNAGKPAPRSFQAAFERLLESPTSPWRQLPFSSPIAIQPAR